MNKAFFLVGGGIDPEVPNEFSPFEYISQLPNLNLYYEENTFFDLNGLYMLQKRSEKCMNSSDSWEIIFK